LFLLLFSNFVFSEETLRQLAEQMDEGLGNQVEEFAKELHDDKDEENSTKDGSTIPSEHDDEEDSDDEDDK
jgi:hypothetical protein